MDDSRDIELEKIIRLGESYKELKATAGWQHLEKQINDRTSVLYQKLVSESDEKKLYRTQGEILGIQSITNLVNVVVEDGELAQQEIKENENGEAKD